MTWKLLQVDRIIFTVFLPLDQQIYSELLHLYFPLEAQTKNEEKTVADEGQEDNTMMAKDDGTKKGEDVEEAETEVKEAGTEEKEGAQTKERSFEENRMATMPILQKSMTDPGRVIAFPVCVCHHGSNIVCFKKPHHTAVP